MQSDALLPYQTGVGIIRDYTGRPQWGLVANTPTFCLARFPFASLKLKRSEMLLSRTLILVQFVNPVGCFQ